MPIRESALERELVQRAGAIGAVVRKYVSPGTAGVADRLVFFQGHVVLVELKQPSRDLEPLQRYEARQMAQVGILTVRVRTQAELAEFLLKLKTGCYRRNG